MSARSFVLGAGAALVAGSLGAGLPVSQVDAARADSRPAASVPAEYPDAAAAVRAARSQAENPVSAHHVFTSGQITIDAFYCTSTEPTQTYTVPKDTNSVYLEAVGGQGETPNPNQTGLGGLGGQVTGGLTVSSGQAFTVQVGCHGTSDGGASAYAAGGARGTGWSNLNIALTVYSYGYDGGGGGGASAVLSGTSPLAVAAGGGGAAGSAPDCFESRGSSDHGFPFFYYCGGSAVEQGGNGGDGGGADTQGTSGVNNPSGPTPDGSDCGSSKTGAKGSDFDQVGGGGAGGGGGGGISGGCGGAAGPAANIDPTHYGTVEGNAGNGGGGGLSYADGSLKQSSVVRSDASGDGYVLFLTSADGVRTTSFGTAGHPQTFCVPDGVNEIFVDALGASGGGGGHDFKGVGTGGPGGGVQAVVPVKERTQLEVSVGEYGGAHGGWGDGKGGDRGTASSDAAKSGAGGGGSSAVKQSATACDQSPLTGLEYLVVGGGGGGGGGDGFLGAGGGDGGAAGHPGQMGENGGAPDGGDPGCGGVAPGGGCQDSRDGGDATGSSTGGGGGGGGAGYTGGGKGHGTHDGDDGGGGGGGGGASYVTPKSPQAAHYYNGPSGDYANDDGRDDGHVDLIVPVPATRSQITIVSGNKQSANPGQRFAQPIVLQYVDALSTGKVAGVPITLSVATDHETPATLEAGDQTGTTVTTTTDAQGKVAFYATSAGSREPGQFAVTASVADDRAHLIKSSEVTLFNTQLLTNIRLTSSDQTSSNGEPLTFEAAITAPNGELVNSGSAQFSVDRSELGAPVPVSAGVAVSQAISSLAPGPHHVQVTYTDVPLGANGPAFANLAQTVSSETASAVSISSSNPHAVSGDRVSFTANVHSRYGAGTPTGTVQFTLGGDDIGQPVAIEADGTAVSQPVTLTIPDGSIGGAQPQTITASYSGDDDYLPAVGTYTQYVRWPTVIDIQSSAPFGDYSDADLTFTGTIEGTWWPDLYPAHTGTMQVFIGDTALTEPFAVRDKVGTSPPIPASKLGPGVHEITIHYSGDDNYGQATSDTFYQIVLDVGLRPPGQGGNPGDLTPVGPGAGGASGLAGTGSDVSSLALLGVSLLALGGLLGGVAGFGRVRRGVRRTGSVRGGRFARRRVRSL
jgi:hypothetical protein